MRWWPPATASRTCSSSRQRATSRRTRELTGGVGPLWQKIALWRPAAVVFIYKRAAAISAGRALAESWGQLPGVALAGRPCFLMPGPYAPVDQVDQGLNFLRNLAAALARGSRLAGGVSDHPASRSGGG